MKSFMAKNHEVIRDWILIDANGLTLGRLAVDIALILRGKNKPQYTPHVDTGDYVIVINASKIEVSGNKFSSKIYHHHTGTPGGLKSITFKDLQKKSPERILEIAVKGMLPKNILGRAMFKKLKIYSGPKHLHEAQNPKKIQNLIFRQGLKG